MNHSWFVESVCREHYGDGQNVKKVFDLQSTVYLANFKIKIEIQIVLKPLLLLSFPQASTPEPTYQALLISHTPFLYFEM